MAVWDNFIFSLNTYLRCKSRLGCENFWCKIPWVPPLKYLRNVMSRIHPPKWKCVQDLRLWVSIAPEYPTTATPKNENLARTWDLGFYLVQSTYSLWKLKFGQHLGFDLGQSSPGTYVGTGVWRLIAVSPNVASCKRLACEYMGMLRTFGSDRKHTQ